MQEIALVLIIPRHSGTVSKAIHCQRRRLEKSFPASKIAMDISIRGCRKISTRTFTTLCLTDTASIETFEHRSRWHIFIIVLQSPQESLALSLLLSHLNSHSEILKCKMLFPMNECRRAIVQGVCLADPIRGIQTLHLGPTNYCRVMIPG